MYHIHFQNWCNFIECFFIIIISSQTLLLTLHMYLICHPLCVYDYHPKKPHMLMNKHHHNVHMENLKSPIKKPLGNET